MTVKSGPVRSGPSRGTKVSREEIDAFKKKTRRAEKAGIYLSEKQRAALATQAQKDVRHNSG